MRPSEGDSPSLRFFAECVSESGEPVDDAEAAALCMNFMVRSLEETALGVSGAMVELISKTMRSVWVEVVVGGPDPCNKDRVV